jgi:hypothetical protein
MVNSQQAWILKRRYKVNSVINYLGRVYQNLTGGNSAPDTLIDWHALTPLPTSGYKGTFIYIGGAQTFTLPANTQVNSVYLNRGLMDDLTDWTLFGTSLTITPTLDVNDEIKVLGLN